MKSGKKKLNRTMKKYHSDWWEAGHNLRIEELTEDEAKAHLYETLKALKALRMRVGQVSDLLRGF